MANWESKFLQLALTRPNMLTKTRALLIGKVVLALFLLSMGVFLIRRVCSLPRVFSLELIAPLAIGLVLIPLGSFLTSVLLYSRLKIARAKIFATFSILILVFMSFAGRHASLYSFINRIGDNGIVSNTEIVIKQNIPNSSKRGDRHH